VRAVLRCLLRTLRRWPSRHQSGALTPVPASRAPSATSTAAAITKVTPDYLGLARKANALPFTAEGVGLPPGPYHEAYRRTLAAQK
jgi:hypothetical protein